MAKVVSVRIFPNPNQRTMLVNFLIPIELDWEDEQAKIEILDQLLYNKLPSRFIEESKLLESVKKSVSKTNCDCTLVKNGTGVFIGIFVYGIANEKLANTLNRVREHVGTLKVLSTPYYPSE